jgi:acyl dehydratase
MDKSEEIKVMSIEERVADIEKRIGTKFDILTREKALGLPHGCYLSNHIASSDNMRRFADAIGDLNPRFRDSEYAKTTKYGRLVAHPLFLQTVYFEAQLHVETEAAGARGFHSSSEWEFFQPVLEDDRIDFNGVMPTDVKVKRSAFSGQMLIVGSACEYRNQRGEVVGLGKGFIHQSAGDQIATRIGKYNEIAKPYRYSDEEIRKIEEDKDKEEMQGSQPRYWEDVAEGDSIGHLVIGPHTIMDSIAHLTAMPSDAIAKGSRLFRIFDKLQTALKVYDPRINAYVNLELPHLDNELGKIVGTPGTYDNGGERESLASILFTNWMGDDGFLWKYSIQFRRFVAHGDTNWFLGKITRKYIDDGKYCVDIEHWGDNQRGERTTVGQATVILPSKVGGQVKYPTPRSLEDVFPTKE